MPLITCAVSSIGCILTHHVCSSVVKGLVTPLPIIFYLIDPPSLLAIIWALVEGIIVLAFGIGLMLVDVGFFLSSTGFGVGLVFINWLIIGLLTVATVVDLIFIFSIVGMPFGLLGLILLIPQFPLFRHIMLDV